MSIKIKRYIKMLSLICVCCIMVVIYIFSSHNALVSTNDSKKVVKVIHRTTEKLLNRKIQTKNLQSTVRKIGHVFEYFALAFFLYWVIYLKKIGKFKTLLLTILLTFIYSITDELHQYFVPGRACEIEDLVKDFVGALMACLLCIIILKIKSKKLKTSTKI